MRKTQTLLATTLACMIAISCSKKVNQSSTTGTTTDSTTTGLAAPPTIWKEHWFEHNQVVSLKYHDTSVAVYFDKDVNTSITWPFTYLAQAWNYTKSVYGSFGADSRLWPIFHAGKYSGGHPSTYMDSSHNLRNVIDVGSSDPNAWVSGVGNDIDLTTHEIGHIVEGASKNVHNSPAFGIWHDSKWMEIYQYDVYLGLGRPDDASRWYNMKIPTTDDFPRAGTHWFRDWFYPVYNSYGKTATLNNFFTLLSKNFPQHVASNGTFSYQEYTRDMNFGEFVHFWSGSAGADLTAQARYAFGSTDESGNDWTAQLAQAKKDFPQIKYSDFTSTGTLTTTSENTNGAAGPEGSQKITDFDLSTKFFLASFPGTLSLQLDFPAAHAMTSYTITSGNDAPDRDPKDWQLFGSNDGTNWTSLDTRTGQSFPDRTQPIVFKTTNTTAYTHYKWTITATNGSTDFQASEWRLLE